MQSSPTNTFPTLNGLNGPGRPTKRTKKIAAELLDAVGAGAPFNIACQAAGVHIDTFCDWRRRDPAFALQVDQAAARGTVSRLKEIEAQGKDGAWQALSWLCERRHPAEFAKPEVALNIGVGIQTGGANGSQNFEAMIISDLEFLGLRKREGYEHRQPIEVESEIVVAPDLSGSLVKADYPTGKIISASQAEANEKRVDKADKRITELIKVKRLGGGKTHNGSSTPESASTMKLAPITMPAGEPSAGWWSQLVRGDSARPIAREAAMMVCQTVVREVLGGNRAQATPIEFAPGEVLLCDVHSAIQTLCGARGWTALTKRAGQA